MGSGSFDSPRGFEASPNTQLSITIPTFNRAEILDYCLGFHIPLARAHGIQIFVVDNASTDSTAEVVHKRMVEYPLIHYHRHEVNIGPDRSFEFALQQPDTEYVWLLGDSYLMPVDGIEYLLTEIECGADRYDMFLFNLDDYVANIPRKVYSDPNLLLSDLFWLTTCMSCLIFSKKLIANADFERYRQTWFIQTGVIYEYIAKMQFKILWEPRLSLNRWQDFHGMRKSGWPSHVIEIWLNSRINTIFSLPPSYTLETKLKVAREVHLYDRVSVMHLIAYRHSGSLTTRTFREYEHVFRIAAPQPRVVILFISLLPRSITKILLRLNNPYRVRSAQKPKPAKRLRPRRKA